MIFFYYNVKLRGKLCRRPAHIEHQVKQVSYSLLSTFCPSDIHPRPLSVLSTHIIIMLCFTLRQHEPSFEGKCALQLQVPLLRPRKDGYYRTSISLRPVKQRASPTNMSFWHRQLTFMNSQGTFWVHSSFLKYIS